MSGMDISGWTGVVVAVAFGIIATYQAAKANRRAKNAEQEAKRLEGAVAAIRGNVATLKDTAVDARELAEESNRIARGVAAGVSESHHVTWDVTWQGHGIALTNTGYDTANSVRAWVEVDGNRVAETVGKLAKGEAVFFDFAGFVDEFCRDRAARRRRSSPHYPVQDYALTYVEYSVSWVSDLGVAHSDFGKYPGYDPEC